MDSITFTIMGISLTILGITFIGWINTELIPHIKKWLLIKRVYKKKGIRAILNSKGERE